MSYTYINEDDIDPELKCTLCNEPFQLPVNCIKCGHTFCQQCIDKWRIIQLSCPSYREYGYTFVPVLTRIVLNQLNRLLVQCLLCKQINIERSNYIDHISYSCPKQIIICTNNCRWKGCRENLEQHLIQCRKTTWWNCFNCITKIS